MATDHGPYLGKTTVCGTDHGNVARVRGGALYVRQITGVTAQGANPVDSAGAQIYPSAVGRAGATAVTAGTTVLVAPVALNFTNVLGAVISSNVAGRAQFASIKGVTSTTVGKKIFFGAGVPAIIPPGPSALYQWARTAAVSTCLGVEVYGGAITGGNVVAVNILYNNTIA